jgi:hypothetical protein
MQSQSQAHRICLTPLAPSRVEPPVCEKRAFAPRTKIATDLYALIYRGITMVHQTKALMITTPLVITCTPMVPN